MPARKVSPIRRQIREDAMAGPLEHEPPADDPPGICFSLYQGHPRDTSALWRRPSPLLPQDHAAVIAQQSFEGFHPGDAAPAGAVKGRLAQHIEGGHWRPPQHLTTTAAFPDF